MNIMKYTASVLLLLLLVPGCSPVKNTGTGAETAESVPEAAETAAETILPAPEAADFEGYEYRIYAFEDGYGYLGNFAVEEDTGDTVVSAIWNRNLAVEDRYNIRISVTVKNDVLTQMKKNAAAGDDFADLANYCIRWQYQNDLMDCTADLLGIPTLRLDAPWWDQDFNAEFTINGILQSSVGDIIGTDEVCTTAYLYNREIFSAVGHASEELYKAVEDGEWTLEKMTGYCGETAADLNGDSKPDKNDRWGSSYDTGTMWILFVGSGYETMSKTASGEYEITLDSERGYDIFSRSLALFDPAVSIHLETGTDAIGAFKNGHTLFIPFLLGNNNQLRDMEDDYGIVPVPKYNAAQPRYYSEASIWTNTVFIPVTVSDLSRTGLITEALAYESQFDFRKAVYDVVLMEKYARDPQSQKMLGLIFSSKKWSLDIAADISGIRSVLGQLSSSQKDTFMSSVAKIEEQVGVKLTKFMDKFNELARK